MKYCFALIIALSAMPLLAQSDATAKPEVEDSAKEADKKTDELTPAQRLQQFLDTQTELNKGIVGETVLNIYVMGFKLGLLTMVVSHSEYNATACYKLTMNMEIEVGLEIKTQVGVMYLSPKLQVLYSDEIDKTGEVIAEKKTKKLIGDELHVHVIEPEAEDEDKRDY
ncbi:MAG: hypothetical protein V3V10_04715, partial [Planctomycetota bacterium]